MKLFAQTCFCIIETHQRLIFFANQAPGWHFWFSNLNKQNVWQQVEYPRFRARPVLHHEDCWKCLWTLYGGNNISFSNIIKIEDTLFKVRVTSGLAISDRDRQQPSSGFFLSPFTTDEPKTDVCFRSSGTIFNDRPRLATVYEGESFVKLDVQWYLAVSAFSESPLL